MTAAVEPRTCEKHGEYLTRHVFREHWTRCPECLLLDERQQRARTEAAQQKDRQGMLLLRSNLVGRYLQTTLEDFATTAPRQPEVLQACRAFVHGFRADQGGGLWLIGPPGTGKTHLGAAMVRAVIEQHHQGAVMASARDIVRDLRRTWRRDSSESETDVIDRYAEPALLVLDEVGVGFSTEGEQIQLFDVLDARYQRMRPTVLLSNLTVPMLQTALGDRVFDRLREGAKVLVCDWPSHRGGGKG